MEALNVMRIIAERTTDSRLREFLNKRIAAGSPDFYSTSLYMHNLNFVQLRDMLKPFGLSVVYNSENAYSIKYYKAKPSVAALLPCRIPDTGNGCSHYDQCYHGKTCKAARRSWENNPNAKRVCGIYYGINAVQRTTQSIKARGSNDD